MGSSLDPVLSAAEASTLESSMTSRVEKSENELQQFSIFHEHSKSSFGTTPDGLEGTRSQASVASKPAGVPEDMELLDTLPKSLSDIYNISNRNRWRNKDKMPQMLFLLPMCWMWRRAAKAQIGTMLRRTQRLVWTMWKAL